MFVYSIYIYYNFNFHNQFESLWKIKISKEFYCSFYNFITVYRISYQCSNFKIFFSDCYLLLFFSISRKERNFYFKLTEIRVDNCLSVLVVIQAAADIIFSLIRKKKSISLLRSYHPLHNTYLEYMYFF